MPDICPTALREAFVGRSYTGLKLVCESETRSTESFPYRYPEDTTRIYPLLTTTFFARLQLSGVFYQVLTSILPSSSATRLPYYAVVPGAFYFSILSTEPLPTRNAFQVSTAKL